LSNVCRIQRLPPTQEAGILGRPRGKPGRAPQQADESIDWLELLSEGMPGCPDAANPLRQEREELVKIRVTIVRKVKG
jgi:hypothetical protein